MQKILENYFLPIRFVYSIGNSIRTLNYVILRFSESDSLALFQAFKLNTFPGGTAS
jgi:hypothetical protein